MSFGERVRTAREARGWSQKELGRRVGISQQAVAKLERKGQGSSRVLGLAAALQVSPEWLQFGTGDRDPTSALGNQEHENVCPGPEPVRAIPEISWVQAGHWHEAVDIYHPGDADHWHFTTKNVGPNAFYLRVEGDSMVAPYGRGYPPGCLILVDPDTAPDVGRRVVARHVETYEVTFKELAYDAGQYYLKPLNPQYHTLTIDSEWEVIGVVREAIVQED